ncbi:hypothetical protein GCM10028856_28990 [Halopiger thermotolerans]
MNCGQVLGTGLEETLTPIGAVIVGALIGLYFALAGIAGVSLRTAAGGDVVTRTRSAGIIGVVSICTAVLGAAGYGYGSGADAGFFFLFGSYFLLLARIQRAQQEPSTAVGGRSRISVPHDTGRARYRSRA